MFGYIQLAGLFHSGPTQQSLAYFSVGLDFCFFWVKQKKKDFD